MKIWDRLKRMKCIDCGKELIKDDKMLIYLCGDPICGFKISFDAFDRTVANLYNKKSRAVGGVDDEERNFEALQNL